jgi:hypothetical protein
MIIGQDSRANINRRSQITGRAEGTWPVWLPANRRESFCTGRSLRFVNHDSALSHLGHADRPNERTSGRRGFSNQRVPPVTRVAQPVTSPRRTFREPRIRLRLSACELHGTHAPCVSIPGNRICSLYRSPDVVFACRDFSSRRQYP